MNERFVTYRRRWNGFAAGAETEGWKRDEEGVDRGDGMGYVSLACVAWWPIWREIVRLGIVFEGVGFVMVLRALDVGFKRKGGRTACCRASGDGRIRCANGRVCVVNISYLSPPHHMEEDWGDVPRVVAPPPATRILLRHDRLVPIPVEKQQNHTRDEEEYTIHDPERETRLQHCAILVHIPREGRVRGYAVRASADVESAVAGDVAAVGAGYTPELVDAGDEGADEAEVDEGDEDCGGAGGFVAEEG